MLTSVMSPTMRRALATAFVGLAAAGVGAASASATVVHIETTAARVLPMAGHPDLPSSYGNWHDEVWFQLDGSGWRAVRTFGDDAAVQNVADARGITVRQLLTGETSFQSASEAPRNFLGRPLVDGIVVEPLTALARGELQLVGETTVRGEPAYELARPADGTANRDRWFAAKDDGALLRSQSREWIVVGDVPADDREATTKLIDSELRTIVKDVVTYERLEETRAEAAARARAQRATVARASRSAAKRSGGARGLRLR